MLVGCAHGQGHYVPPPCSPSESGDQLVQPAGKGGCVAVSVWCVCVKGADGRLPLFIWNEDGGFYFCF